MATRRQMGLGGEREDEEEYGIAPGFESDNALGLFGNPPAPAGSNQAPSTIDEMFEKEGTGLPPANAPDQVGPGGSTDRARELGPNLAPTQQIQIPQGVTVPERGYEPPTQDVAAMPDSPQPSIMGDPAPFSMPDPSSLMGGGPAGYGTRRPPLESSSAASSIFGEDPAGGGLFGSAGGLNEGGIGLPGSAGPPAPTKMMQALLQALKLR